MLVAGSSTVAQTLSFKRSTSNRTSQASRAWICLDMLRMHVFSCNEHDAPTDAQAEGSSQKSNEETQGAIENNDSVSVNSKN